MPETLWAPYGDALKLILAGSTTATLSNDQRTIFMNMLSQGRRDENGAEVETRHLPSVNTNKQCIDKDKQIFEVFYYIPDLFKFMIEIYGKWSISTLPVNFDYLNSLKDSSGDVPFSLDDAPDSNEWLYSPEGKEYWGLLSERLKLKNKLAELERTDSGGKASEMEANERLHIGWNHRVTEITNKLKTLDSADVKKAITSTYKETKYLPYLRAIQRLQSRLNTTPEELAAWIFMGPNDGGLNAYVNANELDPPPRFAYTLGNFDDSDYISPLMSCWFGIDEIDGFQPAERFITGKALIARWAEQQNLIPEAFIKAKIAESRLLDMHPLLGLTQGSSPDNLTLPPLEDALFMISHIEEIELDEFNISTILHSSNRDKELQECANALATQWKKDNRKSFSKREIANSLASSNEWREMTATRIERIIIKDW